MIIKNLGKNFFINLSLVLLIFIFDRITKIYIISLDKKFLESEIFSSKFLNIALIWNEGIAFGLFSFSDKDIYHSFTILIILVITGVFYIFIKSKGFEKYALIMILGGALGNVFDRIFYKAVPDFIDFHINNFHWFIFNLADIFITLGVIFMILLEFAYSDKKNKN